MGDAHNFLSNSVYHFSLFITDLVSKVLLGTGACFRAVTQILWSQIQPDLYWYMWTPTPTQRTYLFLLKLVLSAVFPLLVVFFLFFMFSSAFLNISVSPPSWPAAFTSNWPGQLASAAACHLFFFFFWLRLNLGKFYFSTESCLFSHTALLLLIQSHVIVLSPA